MTIATIWGTLFFAGLAWLLTFATIYYAWRARRQRDPVIWVFYPFLITHIACMFAINFLITLDLNFRIIRNTLSFEARITLEDYTLVAANITWVTGFFLTVAAGIMTFIRLKDDHSSYRLICMALLSALTIFLIVHGF